MAGRVGTTRSPEGHRLQKLLERAALIAARGRQLLFIYNDLAGVGTGVIFEKALASGFFQSVGDSIHFTVSGRIPNNGRAGNQLSLTIKNGNGVTLVGPVYGPSYGVSAPAIPVSFILTGTIQLNSEKQYGIAWNAVWSDGTTYEGAVFTASGTSANDTGKIVFLFEYADAVFEIDLFRAEFCPGHV